MYFCLNKIFSKNHKQLTSIYIDGRKLPIKIKEEGLNPEYSGNNDLFMNEFKKVEFTPPEKAIKELYFWYKDSSNIVLNENMSNSTNQNNQ